LDLSGCSLEYVIEDDMTMFKNLSTLNVSENFIPFAKLGLLPGLKKLNFSCNRLGYLDLEVDGRFKTLESLDLSHNQVTDAALIVLATLPKLQYLDLSKNRLKRVTPFIHDMDHWRDRVIEFILPEEVVSSLNVTVSKKKSLEQLYIDIDNYSGVSGFLALETLVLDSNPLGIETQNFWRVLGRMPNLKNLNVNRTMIQSLRPLITESWNLKTGDEILLNITETIPKYKGFFKLENLHATHNLMKTLDDIIGFLFLPCIKKIYLEGNPVMKEAVANSRLKKKSKPLSLDQASGIFSLDYIPYIRKSFGILIADQTFNNSPSTIPDMLISIKKTNSVIPLRDQKRLGPREFLHKRVKVSGDNLIVPHVVEDVISSNKKQVMERSMKRRHNFSEKDLEYIVKSGKIPSIKALMEYKDDLFNRQNLKAIEDEEESDKHISDHENGKDQNHSANSDFINQTFLTSVDIVEKEFKTEERPDGMPDWYRADLDLQMELGGVLPGNILATVKTLRQALRNPGSIWRSAQLDIKKDILNQPERTVRIPSKKNQRQANAQLPIDEFKDMEDTIKEISVQMKGLETNLGI
jgi:hypothetical protein